MNSSLAFTVVPLLIMPPPSPTCTVLPVCLCVAQFQSFILTVTFFIIQLGAMIWYALSYIPFAREMAMRLFGRLT